MYIVQNAPIQDNIKQSRTNLCMVTCLFHTKINETITFDTLKEGLMKVRMEFAWF